MSFQYNTKTIEELQSITRVIVNNFSEIIGCSKSSKTWSPPTASTVCNSLSLAGSNCSNISDMYEYSNDALSYKFTSVTNSCMKDIWVRVLNFEPSIFNLDKLATIKISSSLSLEDRLKVCVDQSTDYSSTILESISKNTELVYSDDYRRVMWIILACFSVRYSIFDFSIGASSSINLELVNSSFIDRIIENIMYEKYSLIKFEKETDMYDSSSEFISQQLSILMKNCKQLKSYVLAYLK